MLLITCGLNANYVSKLKSRNPLKAIRTGLVRGLTCFESDKLVYPSLWYSILNWKTPYTSGTLIETWYKPCNTQWEKHILIIKNSENFQETHIFFWLLPSDQLTLFSERMGSSCKIVVEHRWQHTVPKLFPTTHKFLQSIPVQTQICYSLLTNIYTPTFRKRNYQLVIDPVHCRFLWLTDFVVFNIHSLQWPGRWLNTTHPPPMHLGFNQVKHHKKCSQESHQLHILSNVHLSYKQTLYLIS